MDREYGWNDTIQNDGEDFVLLPAGEYDFTVKGFERGRFAGSEKLPPCNMAVLSIEIDGGEHGVAFTKHRLYLHSKTEGLLCEFFRSIGARKHGEALRMDWARVTGSRGRCKTGVREYNGEKYTEIKRFLDPADVGKPAPAATGFQAGVF